MPNQTCFTSLQLCGIRVAELNVNGSPVTGAGHGYVSTSPIKMQIKIESEKGDEFTQKNGCGKLCVEYRDQARIKGASLMLELCQLDSALISLITGADNISSGANVIGMQVPAVTGDSDPGVCIEAWSKAWDGNQQAVPAFTTPNVAYYHWVWPRVRFIQGDIMLENGIAVIPVDGEANENARITANGPYDDWPTPVQNAGGITRFMGWWLDTAPPQAQCGYIPVTSTAS